MMIHNTRITQILVCITFLLAGASCKREVKNKLVVEPLANGILGLYNADKTFDGYNLVNGCGIYDMLGRHVLSYPGQECRYYSNGDIVSGIELDYLFMYHKDLSPLWRTPSFHEEGVHHDICIAPDSSVYFFSSDIQPLTLSYGAKIEKVISLRNPGGKGFVHSDDIHPFYINGPVRFDSLRFDVMYHISRSGKILSRWNSFEQLDALKKIITSSPRSAVYCDSLPRKVAEYFHFNSIQTLPHNPFEKTHPEFKAGNLLLSDMYFDMVFIMTPDNYEIVWSYFQQEMNGHGQHTARMQPNGLITMIVNQCTLADGTKYSKVIDLNPVTKTIEWEYVAPKPHDFNTPYEGSAQRLPNGNTLITVGSWRPNDPDSLQNNWAFEVTPDKEMVWKWTPDIHQLDDPDLYRVTRVSKKEMEQFIKHEF
ncbi:MAG: arylsulfotransferase family protein [Chitinophagales bacterium]